MALVAYSDESDISDEEEETSQVPFLKPASNDSIKENLNSSTTKVASTLTNSNNGINNETPTGIDSIVDEDEDFIPTSIDAEDSSNKVLLSSLQAVTRTSTSVNLSNLTLDVGEDEITDVPTKETWKVSQDVLKKMAEKSGDTDSTSLSIKKPAITSATKNTAGASTSEKSKDDDGVPLGRTLGKAQQIALASSALGSLLQKKKTPGGKVQLLLPALSELVEEQDEAIVVDQSVKVVPKKTAPSTAGTGLFALLPKPKHFVKSKEANRSLVPHSLFKKPQPPAPLRPSTPRSQNQGGSKHTSGKKSHNKSSSLGSLGLLSGEQEDSDDEEETASGGVDFFSLDAKDTLHNAPASAAIVEDDSMIVNEIAGPASSVNISNRISNVTSVLSSEPNSTACSNSSLGNVNTIHGAFGTSSSTSSVYDDDRPSEANYGEGDQEDFIPMSTSSNVGSATEIDDDAWRRLTGKKRKAENIDIIEVNADDALLSREEWMNRAASQEKPSHSHSKKKGNLPSQQQKRKHQITYLAHQAKEREIELKNDWSAGKVKKQQTRAKYGF